MSDDRKKKPLWPWIVALLIGLPGLYVASFGPACWIVSRTGMGSGALPGAYRPVTARLMIDGSPAELKRRIRGPKSTAFEDGTYRYRGMTTAIYFYPFGFVNKYASLWAAPNWKWRFQAKIEWSPDPIARMDQGNWEWFRDGK